jgi:hypothetical protein
VKIKQFKSQFCFKPSFGYNKTDFNLVIFILISAKRCL